MIVAYSPFRRPDAPRRPKRLPRPPQDGPRRPQERPKKAQEGPKRAQDAPKTAQGGPNTAPREAQEGEHEQKIRAFRPKRPPGGPKRPQNDSQEASKLYPRSPREALIPREPNECPRNLRPPTQARWRMCRRQLDTIIDTESQDEEQKEKRVGRRKRKL